MVVGNDDLDALLSKFPYGIDIRDSAVDRDKKLGLLLEDLINDVVGPAVSVLFTVGNDI